MITKQQYVEYLICTIGNYTSSHLAKHLDEVSHDVVRIYAPDQDGKTKNEHFSEMVTNAVYAKKIKAKNILFDSWCASAQNLKLVHRLGLIFFTTLKSNRMVSLSKEGSWIHLDQIELTAEPLQNGVRVKLKEVPIKVQLFKVVATNGDTPALAYGASVDWVITNCPDETLTTQAAQNASDMRWQIEELHRGLKQLTGTEKCQCRKGRSQRNHFACCYHAWLSLKVKAKVFGKTLYQTKGDLISDYLRAELAIPRIRAFLPL